jgi:hypothetical protein
MKTWAVILGGAFVLLGLSLPASGSTLFGLVDTGELFASTNGA